jgi:hypothetical protein
MKELRGAADATNRTDETYVSSVRRAFYYSCGAVLARIGNAEKLTVMFYVEPIDGQWLGIIKFLFLARK